MHQKPASVDERRDNRDDKQAKQQPLQPENESSEDKTHSDAKKQNDNEDDTTPREAPCPPPTCRLMMVLYGDQGQTEPLLLGDNESISAVRCRSGIANRFIVSEYANMEIVIG